MPSWITCDYHDNRYKQNSQQLINQTIDSDKIIAMEKVGRWFIKFKMRKQEPVIWSFLNNTGARDKEYERMEQILKNI